MMVLAEFYVANEVRSLGEVVADKMTGKSSIPCKKANCTQKANRIHQVFIS